MITDHVKRISNTLPHRQKANNGNFKVDLRAKRLPIVGKLKTLMTHMYKVNISKRGKRRHSGSENLSSNAEQCRDV